MGTNTTQERQGRTEPRGIIRRVPRKRRKIVFRNGLRSKRRKRILRMGDSNQRHNTVEMQRKSERKSTSNGVPQN
eukprot:scaffold19748_cov42-Attheya_sp.AAC.1